MSSGTVLVVDDEEEVADVYALRLRNEYEATTAYGGEKAIAAIDNGVDIVLLDRRMPDIHGDEVLAEIRDRGYDCKVIMLTAVDPGPEILELEFDDYLCKPVQKADLVAAIDHQLQVTQQDEQLSEYLEVTSKLALLEQELSPPELDESERIEELRERAARLENEVDDDADAFENIEADFLDIARHPG